MRKIIGILTILFFLVLSSAGFLYVEKYRTDIFKNVVKNTAENIDSIKEKIRKTDIGYITSTVEKEFLSPPPLRVEKKFEKVTVLNRDGIIAETNLHRQNNGLSQLLENTELDSAALAKANDILEKQYFDHVSPAGVDPSGLVSNYGYKYIVAGENLILGNFENEKELVQAWMDSPWHRANILNNRYSEIGVAITRGIYKGENVWVGVQEFGLPLTACAEPNIVLKNEIEDKKNQLDQMSAELDFKKNTIEKTDQRDQQYNNLVDKYNQLVAQYQILAGATKNLILQYNTEVSNFNACVAGR